jgi:hypothetical protein
MLKAAAMYHQSILTIAAHSKHMAISALTLTVGAMEGICDV